MSETTSEDFYCDEALSRRTPIEVVVETDEVLAFRHTRPFWPVHIVVIPKQTGTVTFEKVRS